MKRTLLLIVLAGLAGCTPAKPPPRAGAGTGGADLLKNDPCVLRLHDISGAFFLFFARYRDLPASLPQLKQVTDQPLEFFCPASGRPYVYVPVGVPGPGRGALVVLHDDVPVHNGKRLAIAIHPPDDNSASFVAKVIALPTDWTAAPTTQP